MMSEPRAKKLKKSSDCVVVCVGGTEFKTSTVTLTTSSSYFDSLFSDEWRDGNRTDDGSAGGVGGAKDEEIFIDQDPEAFRVLLSYMRLGKVRAASLSPEVLLQARFLGMDRLLAAVRVAAGRAAFAGIDSELVSSAKSAGLLNGDEVKKEYASLVVFNPREVSFEGREGEMDPWLVTKVSVSSKDSSGSPLNTPAYSTFIDGLNWMHRNGFTKFEKQLSEEDLEVRSLGCLCFSKLVEEEAVEDIAETIMSDKMSDAIDQREFASLIEWSPPSGGSIYADVDFGRVTVESVGSSSIEVRTTRIYSNSSASEVVELGNRLQDEGYSERDSMLEEQYFSCLVRAATMGRVTLTKGDVSVRLFTRRMRNAHQL